MPSITQTTAHSLADAISVHLKLRVEKALHGRTMTVCSEKNDAIARYDILSGRVRMSFEPEADIADVERLLTLFLCECCHEHFPIAVTNPEKKLLPTLREFGFKQENRKDNHWLCNST